MSNGRNANHVTLPAVCDHAALRPHAAIFGRRYSARLAIRLAICFRLPLSVAALYRCHMIAVSKHEQDGWAGSQPQRGGNSGPGLNIVLYGDRLFQQYSCAKMEQQRLNYLRFNQNSLELTLSGE